MVYRSDNTMLLFFSIVSVLAGVVGLFATWAQFEAWQAADFAFHFRGLGILGICPLFLLLLYWGGVTLIRLRSRKIRLEVTSKGILFVALRSTSSAGWSSIGPFVALSDRKAVSAKVLGPEVSANLAESGALVISAALFGVDEGTLAKRLNDARPLS